MEHICEKIKELRKEGIYTGTLFHREDGKWWFGNTGEYPEMQFFFCPFCGVDLEWEGA